MPFSRAISLASRLRAAAIREMVSPFRARILVNPAAAGSVVLGFARRQLVKRTELLGTTNFVVDLRSTPGFIACS
jgi:hypothetical protein